MVVEMIPIRKIHFIFLSKGEDQIHQKHNEIEREGSSVIKVDYREKEIAKAKLVVCPPNIYFTLN